MAGSASITDNGFPRAARLLAQSDFKSVFSQAHRSSDRYFTVLATTRGGGGPARLGLAIAKKAARRAVDRNRLKRLAREIFRRHRCGMNGLDLVVMARHEAVHADNATLSASLLQHFSTLAERFATSTPASR